MGRQFTPTAQAKFTVPPSLRFPLFSRSVRSNTNRVGKVYERAQLKTPSLRFPLQAGGTAWTRGSVPLAKRGEPKGGGAIHKL
jgi:hypothetical protein